MSPELEQAYAESYRPFFQGGGAITEEVTKLRPWRVFLEINSGCNLKCPSCTKGNTSAINGLKYEHQTGFMDEDLMERILDKIASENPDAIVFTYGNSEPWLNPRLPECLASIKRRGLHPQFSTNLNYVQRVDETLAAQPDMIIISLSGFTQEIYERGHDGGNIDKVKAHMRIVAEANDRAKPRINIAVNFHVYLDNEHEIAPMKEYAEGLGLGFFTSFARAISMENTIQYVRHKDPEATPFEVQEGRPDWNHVFPPVTDNYLKTMARLHIPPEQAIEMYKDLPKSHLCPVGAGSLFTFIRHDGKTQLCACSADRRITLGDYLDTSADELRESRVGHSVCQQCLKYRLGPYYMIVTRNAWVSPE